MLKYELKKLVFNRLFAISTILLFALFLFVIWQNNNWEDQDNSNAQKYFQQIDFSKSASEVLAGIDNEIAELKPIVYDEEGYLQGKYTVSKMGDYHILLSAKYQIEYAESVFPDLMKKEVARANNLYHQEKLAENPDKFKLRQYKNIINAYNQVKEISVVEPSGINAFLMTHFTFDYTGYWRYIFTIWAILLTIELFYADSRKNRYPQLMSTKLGREKLFSKKILAMAIIIVSFVAIMVIKDIIIGSTLYQIRDWNALVQSISNYAYYPFAQSILGFILMQHCLVGVFLFMAVVITALACTLFKRRTAPLVFGIALNIVPSYILSYFNSTNDLMLTQTKSTLRMFLPHELLFREDYFKTFDEGNLFGFSVNRLLCVVLVTCLITIIAYISGRYFYRTVRRA